MSALIQHPDEGKDWITTFLVNEKKTDENRGGGGGGWLLSVAYFWAPMVMQHPGGGNHIPQMAPDEYRHHRIAECFKCTIVCHAQARKSLPQD